MLPTGYGKNLLYELFPIVSEEILGQSCCVFVFEPLNVIIQQQVRKLGSFATCLKEKNDASVLQKLRSGDFRFQTKCYLDEINIDFTPFLLHLLELTDRLVMREIL